MPGRRSRKLYTGIAIPVCTLIILRVALLLCCCARAGGGLTTPQCENIHMPISDTALDRSTLPYTELVSWQGCITMSEPSIYAALYRPNLNQRLLLSGDVELNPGPWPALSQTRPPAKNTRNSTRSTSDGDSANGSLNEATTPQVPDTMETNMNDLVTEMRLLKTEVINITGISRIKEKVDRLNEDINNLKEENKDIKKVMKECKVRIYLFSRG